MGRGTLVFGLKALHDEFFHFFIEDTFKSLWADAMNHLVINLCWIIALHVRALQGYHFDDAHTESIDIYSGVVALFVELRSHEFWSSED